MFTLERYVKLYRMKIRLFTTVGLIIGAFTAYAQEGQFPMNQEEEVQTTPTTSSEAAEGGFQIWDNPSGITQPAADVVSGAATATATQKNAVVIPATPHGKKQALKEDDSVLSFNFLYYLIQKFKLSESVE